MARAAATEQAGSSEADGNDFVHSDDAIMMQGEPPASPVLVSPECRP